MASKPIRWQMKPKVGDHYMNGRRYQAGDGQIVTATRQQMGQAIDKFIPLDDVPDDGDFAPKHGLVKVHKGGGWYDVVRTDTGEIINDVPLRAAAADGMVTEGLNDDSDEASQGAGSRRSDKSEGADDRRGEKGEGGGAKGAAASAGAEV